MNATPVGGWPQASGDPDIEAPRRCRVYDLVCNPIDAEFLKRARQAGARTIGGLDMLVEQAARQFEWWTGHIDRRTTLMEPSRARRF